MTIKKDSATLINPSAPATKKERLDCFCEGLCNGLSQVQAYVNAGYADGPSARKNASAFHKSNYQYVQAYISEHIGSHAPTALTVILQIMNSESEKGGIRLKAAQDILDRAGYSAKQKVEFSAKDVKDMSTEDLQKQIQEMLADDPKLAKVFTFPQRA